MERPLQISFHNVQSSATLEAAIREHVGKLAARYDRLTGCRVTVESPHRQHRTDKAFQVHIVMTVPGRELAVSRDPQNPLHDRHAGADVYTSLRDAFAAAERQLTEFKAQQRGG